MKYFYLNKISLLFFIAIPVLLNVIALLIDHPYFRLTSRVSHIEIFTLIIFSGALFSLTFNYFTEARKKRLKNTNIKDSLFFYYLIILSWLIFLVPSYFLLQDLEAPSKPKFASDKVSESSAEPNNSIDSENIDEAYKPTSPSFKIEPRRPGVEEKINANSLVAFEVNLESRVPLYIQFIKHVRDKLNKHLPQKDIPNQQQYMMFGKDLAIASSEKDWERFEELIEKNRGEIEEIDTIALTLLLMNKRPPQELIEKYVDSGAIIIPTALTNQLASGNYEMLTKFENYGINVFGELEAGITLFDFALLQGLTRESFDFAISRTETLGYKEYLGTDSLGIVLANASTHGENTAYFISQLLNTGAVITEQHRQMFERLSIDDPQLAENLKYSVAELAK